MWYPLMMLNIVVIFKYLRRVNNVGISNRLSMASYSEQRCPIRQTLQANFCTPSRIVDRFRHVGIPKLTGIFQVWSDTCDIYIFQGIGTSPVPK